MNTLPEKKSGRIISLADGRTAIEYHEQPFAEVGKIIWYMVDENRKLIRNEKGDPSVLIMKGQKYIDAIATGKLIGYVD